MTDKIAVVCPGCGRSGKVLAIAMGKRVKCPACQHHYHLTESQVRAEGPDGYALEASPAAVPEPAPKPRPPRPLASPARESSAGKFRLPDPDDEPSRPKWIIPAAGGVAAIIALVIVGAALRARTPGASGGDWATVSPADGGFSVLMPGKQDRQTKTEQDGMGGMLVHKILISQRGTAAYVVDYSELGVDVQRGSLDAFLDAYRDENLRLRNARLVKENDLNIPGNPPGRERLDEFPNPTPGGVMLVSRSRVFVDGNRLFVIAAIGPKGKDGSMLIPDSDRFLDSFRRIKPGNARPAVAAKPPKRPPPQAVAQADPPPEEPKREPEKEPEAPAAPEPPEVAKVAPPDAEKPPAAREDGGAVPDLRYRWKEGKSYVYAVKVVLDAGPSMQVAMEGQSIYKIQAVGPEDFTIAHTGRIETRQQVIQGGRTSTSNRSQTLSTTLKMDAKGEILELDGKFPVPLMGDLAAILIEPFPDSPRREWEDEDFIALTRVEGGSSPVGFGRPSLRDRMRAPSPARPGSGASRLRNRRAPTPPPRPAPTAPTVSTTLAADLAEYTLGSGKGDLVPIHKLYVLLAEGKVNGKPPLELTGEGDIEFDRQAGVPRKVDSRTIVTVRGPNGEVRIPITVSCKLLEGADRETALKPPPPPVVAATANKAVKGADVDRLLQALKAGGNPAREACRALFESAPLEPRRRDVSRVLQAYLTDPDVFARGDVIRALGVWGDEAAVSALLDRMNDDRYGCRGEIQEALCRLAPRHHAAMAEPLAAWLSRDAGLVGKVYRAMGAEAEAELLKVIQGPGDVRGRVEACRIIRDVGTGDSLPALREIAGHKADESVGRVAESAIRAIFSRKVTEAMVAEVLLDFRGDEGRKSRACERLAGVQAPAGKKAEIARVLEAMLDDPGNGVRVRAGHALAAWGDDQSIRVMIDHVADPKYREWRELSEDVYKLGGGVGEIDALASRDREDHAHAFRLFEKIGPASEDAVLRILETHPDNLVRASACRLLKVIGTPKCIPALRKVIAGGEFFQKGPAEETLRAFEQRSISDTEMALTLTVANTSPDANRRREAIERLGNVRPDRASARKGIDALLALTRDPDENVQKAALKALEPWIGRDDLPLLVERVSDKTFRAWREAARLLIKLDPSERTAEAVFARYLDDGFLVGDLMKELGPVAEPALVKAMQSGDGERIRVEAGRLLERQGTEASLDALQDLTKLAGDGQVGAAAEDAVRNIERREAAGPSN